MEAASPDRSDYVHTLERISNLSHSLDERTMSMPGGFDKLAEFQELTQYGEQALEVLVTDIALQTSKTNDWWRLQAAWTIADQLGKPISFEEASRGNYQGVRSAIVNWAMEHKYL